MNVSIRQLSENDWRAFSEMRLKALRTDPKVFGSNFAYESGFTQEDWQTRLSADDAATFMLFDEERPIGITGVGIFSEDPTGRTAILWGSWLEPEYRGKGLSDLMYRARIAWAKTRPDIERIIVSHRASNVASKFANQKHGFVFTKTNDKLWPDGATENEVCYELRLSEK